MKLLALKYIPTGEFHTRTGCFRLTSDPTLVGFYGDISSLNKHIGQVRRYLTRLNSNIGQLDKSRKEYFINTLQKYKEILDNSEIVVIDLAASTYTGVNSKEYIQEKVLKYL
jgi:hypothetical protein